jgi:hypothetical protein
MNRAIPISKHDLPLFNAWCEGFRAADKEIVANPYARDARNPRLAANFTEGFNTGRQVHKMKEVL